MIEIINSIIMALTCIGLFIFVRYFKRTEILDLLNKIVLLNEDKKFYIRRAENAEKGEKQTQAILAHIRAGIPILEAEIKFLKEQHMKQHVKLLNGEY